MNKTEKILLGIWFVLVGILLILGLMYYNNPQATLNLLFGLHTTPTVELKCLPPDGWKDAGDYVLITEGAFMAGDLHLDNANSALLVENGRSPVIIPPNTQDVIEIDGIEPIEYFYDCMGTFWFPFEVLYRVDTTHK